MFATLNDVTRSTGKTVDLQTLQQAQTIIEAYVGRPEAEIDGARDFFLLGLATSYQAAYMLDNAETIFSQIKAATIGQNNMVIRLFANTDSPYIAPLAEMACRGLSWKKSTSIRTGSAFDMPGLPDGIDGSNAWEADYAGGYGTQDGWWGSQPWSGD